MKNLGFIENNFYSFKDKCTEYMYCYQKAKWNIEKISKQSNANGYIVQMVKMKIEKTDFKKVKQYFEAWKVEDGQTYSFDNSSFDDIFLVGKESYCSFNELKMSIGKCGESCFEGTIFWIDKSDILYKDICKWKEGAVPEAKELPSIEYSSQLEKEFNKRNYFKRKPFVHKWDMTQEQCIFRITCEYLYKECNGYDNKLKKLKLDNYINDLFSEDYYEIKQRVLNQMKKQLQIENF